MCIGKYSSADGVADEDFATLAACRLEVAGALKCEASVRGARALTAPHTTRLALYTPRPRRVAPPVLRQRRASCRAPKHPARRACASQSLALSMGMSHDFETAIGAGATHVRVGSTIFGARAQKVAAQAAAAAQ
eukprot:2079574-Prymnesium_polylepis.2